MVIFVHIDPSQLLGVFSRMYTYTHVHPADWLLRRKVTVS